MKQWRKISGDELEAAMVSNMIECAIVDQDGIVIGVFYSGINRERSQECHEAAALATASPDLYSALETALNVMVVAYRVSVSRALYDSDQEYEFSINEHVGIKAARAALAKARGEA